jgi:hypothetical protein
MDKLKEFLDQQAEENTAANEESRRLKDWVQAVERLVETLSDWLRASDTKNRLKIEKTKYEIRERAFGWYSTPGLRVTFSTREFQVVPKAFFSIGSVVGDPLGETIRNGRVDLTNGNLRFMLYRKPSEGPDAWVIADDRTYQPRLLDRDSFEDAVVSLLQ